MDCGWPVLFTPTSLLGFFLRDGCVERVEDMNVCVCVV